MSKRKDMTIAEVIESARSSWSGSEGDRRADSVRAVIEDVCNEYSEAFGLTHDEVFEAIEAQRDYSAVNYYQRASFPALDGVTVYGDLDEFKATVNGQGFRCPSCCEVSSNPYECDAGDCDWKSYGLFRCMGKGHKVLVRSMFPERLKPDEIFMPVALESSDGDRER